MVSAFLSSTDVCSPESVQIPESHVSPTMHPDQSDGVWKQELPPAIEDGEKGTENVSLFFTNSNSALRKVKTDRSKRKQIIPTEEPGCSDVNVSVTENAASTEQEANIQEPEQLPSSPPEKTCDNGITQWSPLDLSEIPSCTASCYDNSAIIQVKNNIFTEQLQKDSDSSAEVRKPLTVTDSGFTKKKRKFIYNVKTPKQPVEEEETQNQKLVSPQSIIDSGKHFSCN